MKKRKQIQAELEQLTEMEKNAPLSSAGKHVVLIMINVLSWVLDHPSMSPTELLKSLWLPTATKPK